MKIDFLLYEHLNKFTFDPFANLVTSQLINIVYMQSADLSVNCCFEL